MGENIINKINLNGVDYSIQEDKLIKTTYSELKSLRDNSKLVPGCQYRITDYEFTTTQSNTKSAGNVFDIIVLATDENQLSELARAIQHEGDTYFDGNDLNAWELWYDLDNDTDKYEWADSESGKGVIYRIIDEKRNDCPYDFKNALFYNTKLTTSTTSDKYYYTFSYVISGELYDGTVEKQVHRCQDNSMGVCPHSIIKSKKSLNLNVFRNTLFSTSCDSNIFGNDCHNNTFGDSCDSNTFGDYCDSNIFGNDCSYNTFRSYCQSNTFGNSCYYNKFECFCSYNKFGGSCQNNIFGYECKSNTFGNKCQCNKFGNSCSSNIFGYECKSNTFGDYYNYNTFGNECQCNKFGKHCSSNKFKKLCNHNTFGNSCNSNTFGDYYNYNTFGNSCNNNTFGNSCFYNTFGDNFVVNTFGNECNYNTFGDSCVYNTFGDNVSNRESNSDKTSITLNDEYFDDGSGQLVPIKHPDLSTQPSILPYKFMGQYVYEQLIPVKVGDRVVGCNFEVEHPMILSAGVFGVNSFKNVDIMATKSDALLLSTESELGGYINVKYTDGSQFLPSNGYGYGYYGYGSNNTDSSALIDFGLSPDGTQYIYDSNTETLSLYKSGEIAQDSFPQNLQAKNIILGEGVTNIERHAFSYLSSLTSITIPDGVISIGDYAFHFCSNLTAITIPSSVTSIGGSAFQSCSSLADIHIGSIESWLKINYSGDYSHPNYSGKDVKLYLDGELLTEVEIPATVNSIPSHAFRNCRSLTSITIPKNVMSIGYTAFYNCSNLKTVINYSNLTILAGSSSNGYIAYYANRAINVDEFINEYAFKTTDGVHYLTGYMGDDIELTLPAYYKGNSYQIGKDAFRKYNSLTSIVIPESVTSIEESAFSYCHSLTSINIPASVTSIQPRVFADCSSLASINIPEGVTTIGEQAFSYCHSLTSINIPASVTSIEVGAFYDCSNLVSISIPASVTSIGSSTFSGCARLASVDIPENSQLTSIGGWTFERCSSLTSINIPESVTNIKNHAFYACSNLTTINIPESVTSIEESAFSGCSSLTSINIPEGVTSIGKNTFSSCISLTSVTLPESLTSIGNSAFEDCRSLTSISSNAVIPPTVSTNTFNNVNKSIPVYVPAESVDAYKVADVWKDFTNIQAI